MFWEELYIRSGNSPCMDQHLYKYLVLNRKLSIPQLGSFCIKQESAHIDADGFVHPPKPVLCFTEELIPPPDKTFYHFLSEEMGVDELAAIKQFHDYEYQIRQELENSKRVTMTGIGNLNKENGATIVFEPAHDLSVLLPPIHLDKNEFSSTPAVIEEIDEAETGEETKRDYWWFYAIILLILGIGALVYYYL
jgi:hypothetical protein